MEANYYLGKYLGSYKILKLLDRGSFGSVFLAQHNVLERMVAIKVLHSMHLGDTEVREGFLQEARLLEQLKHPCILPLLDMDIEDGIPYLITEYAPKGSLRQRLRARQPARLPTQEALHILERVAEGLAYAHQQQIIHRDLKPENILFNTADEALLADFGLATVLATASMKYVGQAGTPSYMAPEQFKGIVCKESDQYALGCLAYELLTGQKPFQGSDPVALMYQHVMERPRPPRTLNPDLSAEVEQVVLKAMAKERNARYPDVHSFIQALLSTTSTPPNAVSSHPDSQVAGQVPVEQIQTPIEQPIEVASSHVQEIAPFPGESIPPFKGFRVLEDIEEHIPTVKRAQDGQVKTTIVSALSTLPDEQKKASEQELLPTQGAATLIPGKAVTTPVLPSTSTRKTRGALARRPRQLVIVALLILVGIGSPLLFMVFPLFSPAHNSQRATPSLVKEQSYPSPTPTTAATPTSTTMANEPTPTPTSSPTATAVSAGPVQGTLSVSPVSIVNAFEGAGNTFTNPDTNCGGNSWRDTLHATCPLVVKNTSSTDTLAWSASTNVAHATLSPTSGSLPPGQTVTLQLELAMQCPVTGTVTLVGSGNTVQVPIVCSAISTFPDPTQNQHLDSSTGGCKKQADGSWYCSVTVYGNAKNSVDTVWKAYTNPSVQVSPPGGTLSPGGYTYVYITIPAAQCPSSGAVGGPIDFVVPGADQGIGRLYYTCQ